MQANTRALAALMFGQAVSAAGSGLTVIAMQWDLWSRQQSGLVLALFWVSAALPYVLLGPFAGVLVDRLERRRAIVGADLLSGVITAGGALLLGRGHLSPAFACALAAVTACTRLLHGPAVAAFIPEVAEAGKLSRVNSLLSFTQGAAQLLAPALGGFLLAAGWQVRHLLTADATTYLAAALLLLLVRLPALRGGAAGAPRLLTDMREGFAYIKGERMLVGLLALFALINLLGSGLSVTLPPLVTERFGGGPGLLGATEAAIGAGVLGGSALLTVWAGPKGLISGTLGALALGAASQLLAGAATVPWLMLVGLAVSVAGWLMANTLLTTLYQQRVPGALQGRVFALKSSLEQLTYPVSLMLTGLLVPGLVAAHRFLTGTGALMLLSIAVAAPFFGARGLFTRGGG